MPTDVIAYRLAEVSGMLPLLHVRPGPTEVLVLGPLAQSMAQEILMWRDVAKVFTLAALPGTKDSRIHVVDKLPPASCDVIVLSPDQALHTPLLSALRPGGVIQVMTTDVTKVRPLMTTLKDALGVAVPWREHLPTTLWGVIGCVGKSCKRIRQPRANAKRLTPQYLPCLFTFGRDELPLVFQTNQGTLPPN